MIALAMLGGYVVYRRSTHQDLDPRLRRVPWLRRLLISPAYERFVGVVWEQGGRSFRTTWDVSHSIALSRQIFVPTHMHGRDAYRYKPDLQAIDVTLWSGLDHRSFLLKARPRIVRALEECEVLRRIDHQTETNGFKLSLEPIPGAPAVLFVGDSFTEGLHVASPDTFVTLFGQTLRAGGARANVVNAGVNGYSPFEEEWTVERFAERVSARVVVAVLFPNDVERDFLGVLRGNAQESSFVEMFRDLDRLAAFCAEHRLLLVIAALPPVEQITESLPTTHWQQRVSDWCGRHAVAFLDPLPDFRAHGGARLYLGWDPHLAESGHRRFAEFLAEHALEPISRGLADSPARP